MERIVKYKCDYCGREFVYIDECCLHEMSCEKNTDIIATESMIIDLQNDLFAELKVFNPRISVAKNSKVDIQFIENHSLSIPNFTIQISYDKSLGFHVNSIDKGKFSDRYTNTIVVVKSIVQGVLNRINE